MIKSKILRWTGHIVRMDEGKKAFKILSGKSAVKKPLEGQGNDRRKILE
jgi:hypothetical protein